MGSSFNTQILVEKLAKLNPSQASIETLSHWCIFHMNKAKQVVETWDRQFHCCPREQRLAFLYLANDILQNSRRKGSDFVAEFWRVLPGALRSVIENGDEAGRNAALRLINIWDERKVFGSHGQALKDEFLGKHSGSGNRNGKHVDFKMKQPAGSTLDKIILSYQAVHSGQVDENVIINKCRNAISCFEKVEKEADSNMNSEMFRGPAFAEEMQGQHAVLRDSVNQLKAIELSRGGLVSQLREALHQEESKLEQVRNQLQVAQSQLEHANKICQQLVHSSNPKEADPRKSAAAAVAAQLTASTSSAEMLSFVLSSLASEGVIGTQPKDPSTEYPSEKRPKLEPDQPYIPTTGQQPPLVEAPPLPSSPPPQQPLPPMTAYSVPQYLQPVNVAQYGYSVPQQQPGYPGVGTQMTGIAPYTGPASNSFQGYQGSDGNLYAQQSSVPMAPMSRQ